MASDKDKKQSAFLWSIKGLVLLILAACSISLWSGHLEALLQAVPRLTLSRASDNYRLDPTFNKEAQPRERFYDWTIERQRLSPDGVLRDMITVNGRFPGPTIEANVGDTISVRVRNQLPVNLTQSSFDRFSTQMTEVHSPSTDSQIALHWHGLSMRGNPQSDGAHGFTSCAYGPGSEHTYRFVLHEEDSGTHWWHSHVGMSRSDGLWGTFIVHSKKEREALKKANASISKTEPSLEWDQEEIITLGDHYHTTGAEQLSWFMSRYSLGFEPTPDSSLINGKNAFECKRALNPDIECHEPGTTLGGRHAELVFDRTKRYRLRLVNVGAVADQIFSIDGHTLTIIEADGLLIEPLTVHKLPISAGQRYSVLLNPPSTLQSELEKTQAFSLRAETEPECFNIPNPSLEFEAIAIVRYPGSHKSGSGPRISSAGLELRSRGIEVNRSGSKSNREVQVLPKSQPWPKISEPGVPDEACHDMEPTSLIPLVEERAPDFDPEVDTRVVVAITLPKLEKHKLSPMSYLNRTTWRGDHSEPLLQKYLTASNVTNELDFDLKDPVKSGIYNPKHQLIVNPHPSEKRVVEMILNNRDEGPHPFHLHGHKFWVLEVHESDYGWGTYKDEGQSVNYDLSKAVKRDTLNVPRRGYAVLRWIADNPGVHAFHCHVLVHMASGMAMAFVDQPALLSNLSIPVEKCEVPIQEGMPFAQDS